MARIGVVSAAYWGDVMPFVPIADELAHAGDHGTTAAALLAGVPQVVIPQTFDQGAHADRLTDLGVAVQLSWRRRSHTRIQRAVRHATSRGMVDRARVAAAMAGEDGPAVAAERIEALL